MNPRVLVAQLGARMHYAVPRILFSAGALDHFYTDICATAPLASSLRLLPPGIVPAPLRRLAMRRPGAIPKERVRSFPALGLAYALRRAHARTPTEMAEAHLKMGQEFCRRVLAAGFGDANMVYGFNTAALELLTKARKSGLTTILEMTIAPLETQDALLLEQSERFPGWAVPMVDRHVSEQFYVREHAEWEVADLILCGSEFVRQSIGRCGGPVDRCVVLPYGVDHRFLLEPREMRSGPLHVLTIGEVGLRKGSPYVLEAARRLAGRASFRMVGSCSLPPAAAQAAQSGVEFTGTVARDDILEHYAWADVFLLPSICEGSATVVYEALAAGLPVVCTPNTGSVVRDGVEGFIVPTGDSDAIVHALDTLERNPELRHDMAERSQQRFREYDFDSYGKRLLSTLCAQEGISLPVSSAEGARSTVAVA